MTLAIGSITIGLILAMLAFGILISFRVVAFEDLTVDGSLALGGAVTACCIVTDWNPIAATILGSLAGGCAGAVTAFINTKLEINRLLSGILVMTGLYSINLRIMGKSNVPLKSKPTIIDYSDGLANSLFGEREIVDFVYWEVPARDFCAMLMMLFIVVCLGCLLALFFRTNYGLAMQAIGDNSRMTRALGVNVKRTSIVALFLANALTATSGSLLAQYQGFADVQMGIGMLVWGVASMILGESLVGTKKIGFLIAGAMMGSVLFRLLVAIALRWGLNPNDLKLITAVFVLMALMLPKFVGLRSMILRNFSRA